MRRYLVLLFFMLFSCNMAWAQTGTGFAERPDVQAFIQQMVKKHGFSKTQLVALFNHVKLRPQIIRQVKKPLESETWHTYQRLFINEWRIEHGVEFWNRYARVLNEAEKRFGIPASIIVATIGIETKYGQKTGEYRVLDSLSNIGFSQSSRAAFFRSELEEFLLLTREQHLDPLKVLGSYAGAIGQPQFMPSSYRRYAINFSGSGKTDLMHNEVDVIGSIANYYKKHGWETNQPVAAPALMVGDRYNYLLKNGKINQKLLVSDLSQYGIVPKRKIDQEITMAKLIELQSFYKKEYWLGFHNFDVIRRYNASNLYAMAVFQLSNYITALRERLNEG